jgi:diguanylate cyclase (GGDEF)-like protein
VNAETCDRADLISRLFRETDRAQRMKTPLSLIALCIVELDDIHRQYGVEASDDAIRQVSGRTLRLMRSYDLLGHTAFNELLLALPGCSILNATILAERLRVKVFAASFQVAHQRVFLSPCFGVAPAYGRSPIVVLRDASSALQFARAMGPGTIYCLDEQLKAATKLPAPLDQRPVAECSCRESSTNS